MIGKKDGYLPAIREVKFFVLENEVSVTPIKLGIQHTDIGDA